MQKQQDQEVAFAPDFLHVPTIVAFDRGLQPLDSLVYATVYWLERLRDGRCFASNATLAKIVGSSSGGVANSLVRLRDKKYIACIYDDKGQRKEIKTLVYAVVNPYSNDEGGVHQMMNIDTNTKKEILMSDLTDEQKADIDKTYKVWLLHMVIDPEIRYRNNADDLRIALQEAAKRTRLTDTRKAALSRRIKDAGGARLRRSIVALSQSPFHRDGVQGDGSIGNWRASIEWLCKSYEKVEEWSNKYQPEGDNR